MRGEKCPWQRGNKVHENAIALTLGDQEKCIHDPAFSLKKGECRRETVQRRAHGDAREPLPALDDMHSRR